MKLKEQWISLLLNVVMLVMIGSIAYAYNRDIASLEKADTTLKVEIDDKVSKDVFQFIKDDITEIKLDVKELLKQMN